MAYIRDTGGLYMKTKVSDCCYDLRYIGQGRKMTNRAVVNVIAELICYGPAHRLTPFYMLF